MGEPPRLSEIQLPWEKSIIYFVTLCVKDRRQVLANTKVFKAIKTTIHAHWLVSPRIDREISVGDFANGFKRVLRKILADQNWEWQRGCFDRLLRSDENLRNKWIYVQDNPVRQGLVQRLEDWPYYLDFINDEGSCQLPLQAERSRK
jgi:REP element-mobilizing transposase RayT